MTDYALHGKRVVLLDRDGTIIEDSDYCCRVEDVHILPSVVEAIILLRKHGLRIAIISNQSGVGRGYFTETEVEQVNLHIMEELERHGAAIDKVYYCPHHPDDNCDCRKPKPGMILLAAEELGVTTGNLFMVGDKGTDIEAGKAAGCQTVLVTSKSVMADREELVPDYTATDLLEAALWIINNSC